MLLWPVNEFRPRARDHRLIRSCQSLSPSHLYPINDSKILYTRPGRTLLEFPFYLGFLLEKILILGLQGGWNSATFFGDTAA